MAGSISQRQARAVQKATGLPYQKCLTWVREHKAELYERTSALLPQDLGLNEAARRAAVALAEEIGV